MPQIGQNTKWLPVQLPSYWEAALDILTSDLDIRNKVRTLSPNFNDETVSCKTSSLTPPDSFPRDTNGSKCTSSITPLPIPKVQSTVKLMRRLHDAKDLMAQIDLLNQLEPLIVSLYYIQQDKLRDAIINIIKSLLDIIVYQLYGSRHRKYFCQNVLRYGKILDGSRTEKSKKKNEAATPFNYIVQKPSTLYNIIYNHIIITLRNNINTYTVTDLCKIASILTEDAQLFETAFWSDFVLETLPPSENANVTQLVYSSLPDAILHTLTRYLVTDGLSRRKHYASLTADSCSTTATRTGAGDEINSDQDQDVTLPKQQEPDYTDRYKKLDFPCSSLSSLSQLTHNELQFSAKCISLFIPNLIHRVPSCHCKSSKEGNGELFSLDTKNACCSYATFFHQLLGALLNIIGDTTLPREILTMLGNVIGSIILNLHTSCKNALVNVVNALLFCSGPNDRKQQEQNEELQLPYLFTFVVPWWKNVGTLPRLAVLRGLLIQLSNNSSVDTGEEQIGTEVDAETVHKKDKTSPKEQNALETQNALASGYNQKTSTASTGNTTEQATDNSSKNTLVEEHDAIINNSAFINASYPFTSVLTYILNFIGDMTHQTDDPVIRLYIIQSLSVFWSLIPNWETSCQHITKDHIKSIATFIISKAVSLLDSPLKSLSSQCFNTWNAILEYYREELPDSMPIFEIAYQRIMSLGGGCRRYQYLALETLISDLGSDWVLMKQPFLFDHLLSSLLNRSSRGSALQLLSTLLKLFVNDHRQSSHLSSLWGLPAKEDENDILDSPRHSMFSSNAIKQSALVLLGNINVTTMLPYRFAVNQNDKETEILVAHMPRDPNKLAEDAVMHFLPLFGKLFPGLLYALLSFLQSDHLEETPSDRRQCDKEWTLAESAIVLTARQNDRARWLQRDVGTDPATQGFEIWGTDAQGSPGMIRISTIRLLTALANADSRIRLNILSAITYSKQTTATPKDTEWSLVEFMCKTCLKGGTPEERSKTVACIQRFLRRSSNSIKLSLTQCLRPSSDIEHAYTPVYWRILHDMLLYSQVNPANPFDRVGPAFDILKEMYAIVAQVLRDKTQHKEELATLSQTSFNTFFSRKAWDALFVHLTSSWDTQLATVLSILKTFPCAPTDLTKYGELTGIVEPAIYTACLLLNSVKQREYAGGAAALVIISRCYHDQFSSLSSSMAFTSWNTFLEAVSRSLKKSSSKNGNLDESHPSSNETKSDDILIESLTRCFSNYAGEELRSKHLSENRYTEYFACIACDIAQILRPFELVELICKEAHRRLAIFYKSDTQQPSTTIQSCHGIFHFLGTYFAHLPKCSHIDEALFNIVAVKIKDASISDRKQLQNFLSFYARKCIAKTIRNVVEAQWKSTSAVLHCLIDGVDNVLISPDLPEMVHGNSTPLTFHARVQGVDCRGHPVILKNQDSEKQNVDGNCLVEEDIILLSSWMTLKEGADATSKAIEWIDIEASTYSDLNYEFFDLLGHRMITLLLGIKHPAARDRLFNFVLTLARKMLQCTKTQAQLTELPSTWLSRLCYLVVGKAPKSLACDAATNHTSPTVMSNFILPPPLRRSVSLGLAFVALLTANPERYNNSHLFPATMEFLLKYLDEGDIEEDAIATTVHLSNILRHIIQVTSLQARCSQYLPHLLVIATRNLSHPEWMVRNCSHLLFASTVERLTEGIWTVFADEARTSQSQRSDLEKSVHGDASRPRGYFFVPGAAGREEQAEKARRFSDISKDNDGLSKMLVKTLDVSTKTCATLNGVSFRQDKNASAEFYTIQEGVSASTVLFLTKIKIDDPSLIDAIMRYQMTASSFHARVMCARVSANFLMQKANSDFSDIIQHFLNIVQDIQQMYGTTAKEKRNAVTHLAGTPDISSKEEDAHYLTNNAVHGILACLLELTARPVTRNRFVMQLFTGNKKYNPVHFVAELCNRLPLCAPLNITTAIQTADVFVLGVLRVHLSNGGLTYGNAKHVRQSCEKLVSLALSYFSFPVQQRFLLLFSSKNVNKFQSFITPSMAIESGNVSLAVSAARLMIILQLLTANKNSDKLISMSSLLLNAAKFLSNQVNINEKPKANKINNHFKDGDVLPEILIECFRVVQKILKYFQRRPMSEENNFTIPLEETAMKTFVSKVSAQCEILCALLSPQALDIPPENDFFMLHTCSKSMLHEVLLRASKLLLLCISADHIPIPSNDEAKTTPTEFIKYSDILCQCIMTLRNHRPQSSNTLRVIVSIGVQLIHCLRRSTIIPGIKEAIEQATTPLADFKIRYVAANAFAKASAILLWPNETQEVDDLKCCFFLWTRAIFLLVDESPDVQTLAAQAISRAFKRIQEQDLHDVFPDLERRNLFTKTIANNFAIAPMLCLHWAVSCVFTLYPEDIVVAWTADFFHKNTKDINVHRDLSIFLSEEEDSLVKNYDVTKTADRGLGQFLFDQEPPNVFNEDCLLFRLICRTILTKHFGQSKALHLLSPTSLESELAVQITFCRKILQIPSRKSEAKSTINNNTPTHAACNNGTQYKPSGNDDCSSLATTLGNPVYNSVVLPSVYFTLLRAGLHTVVHCHEQCPILADALKELTFAVTSLEFPPEDLTKMISELYVSTQEGWLFHGDNDGVSAKLTSEDALSKMSVFTFGVLNEFCSTHIQSEHAST